MLGRDEKLDRITATMLADSHEMQHVAAKVGFEFERVARENEYRTELIL